LCNSKSPNNNKEMTKKPKKKQQQSAPQWHYVFSAIQTTTRFRFSRNRSRSGSRNPAAIFLTTPKQEEMAFQPRNLPPERHLDNSNPQSNQSY
jgi:hypothetical protein